MLSHPLAIVMHMSSTAVSTSLERTYRYLRIGIAGTVVAIFVAVGQAAATYGWLTSVSDYFYTPARDVFVGALVAASLALLALSGRGAERALLDAAALFAPLIALVPTTVAPGAVPGVAVGCVSRCFPAEYEPDASAGVVVYLVLGALTVAVAVLLIVLRQASLAAVWPSLVVATVVLAVTGLTWAVARETFLDWAHFVATIAFFGLFTAVAVRNAFPRRGPAPAPVFRGLYIAIAAGLTVVLVAYSLLLPQAEGRGIPVVLIAEAAALTLFFAFWVVQGAEKWNDPDPTLRAG